jgi:hypothetical protein
LPLPTIPIRTYDHTTGGGAFNDRTIGRDDDVVESLQGGDFKTGDLVTFLVEGSARVVTK